MEGLIDFLEPIPHGQPFLARGSIAWAPVAFLTEIFRQVEFSNPNPVDFFRGYISLKERTAQECIIRIPGFSVTLPFTLSTCELMKRTQQFATNSVQP